MNLRLRGLGAEHLYLASFSVPAPTVIQTDHLEFLALLTPPCLTAPALHREQGG